MLHVAAPEPEPEPDLAPGGASSDAAAEGLPTTAASAATAEELARAAPARSTMPMSANKRLSAVQAALSAAEAKKEDPTIDYDAVLKKYADCE